MSKAIRQPIDSRRGRQPDAEKTTTYLWITHYARNLVQRFRRHFGVGVQEPKNIAGGGFRSKVHLFRPAACAALDNLITEALRQPIGAVSACAIDDDNFRPTGSFAQIREKSPYQRRLVKYGNNNRDLHGISV